jgi:hypothetical protein
MENTVPLTLPIDETFDVVARCASRSFFSSSGVSFGAPVRPSDGSRTHSAGLWRKRRSRLRSTI